MTEDNVTTTPLSDRPLTAEDGWIEWSGGENPVGEQKVDTRHRHGGENYGWTSAQWGLSWHHERFDPDPEDIIAYRISRPTANVETGASEGGVTSGAGEVGWLRKAVLHLLPRWGMEGHEVPLPGVRGVPNENHSDPRFSVHHYSGHGGNLTVALMIGRDHSQGGIWQEMDFTPEQAVQIAAAILSMPAVEHVAGPLVSALTPSPPVQLSEREREAVAGLEKSLRAFIAWGEAQCPCYNDLPNPCPLCDASIENLEGCKAVEKKFPPRILGDAREALSRASILAALTRTTGEG